jgi:glucoamylase
MAPHLDGEPISGPLAARSVAADAGSGAVGPTLTTSPWLPCRGDDHRRALLMGPAPPVGASPGRIARLAAAGVALVLVASMSILAPRFWKHSYPPLDGQTTVVDLDGRVVTMSQAVPLEPGTRVVVGGPAGAARAQRTWVASSTVGQHIGSPSMYVDALLDLETLNRTYGVTVAGWSPAWRYVWPRDSALVASAYARTGHVETAVEQLEFLQRVQPGGGVFQARYAPDGSGPPDSRGEQIDGTGWALWGMAEVLRQAAPSQRPAIMTRLATLRSRSEGALLALTAGGVRLPPVSADYWETSETGPTLATSALVLAGLRSSQAMAELAGEDASAVRAAADQFEAVVLDAFGADGFPRRLGGRSSSVDLGVAFLLAPFGTITDERVVAAWVGSARHMRRVGGGLAPGGSWRKDGVSWTPTMVTFALVQACQSDRSGLETTLNWIDGHRTSLGSIPEKVRPDGAPAGPAPLAWSSAGVLIAADLADGRC